MRRYLADAVARIREAWGQGECWSEVYRCRVDDLDDFEGLDFESIETFYAEEESDEPE